VTKAERADHVLRRLAELYPDPPIPLDHTDAFTLLIAVLLSAQCTDVRVNQITPKLFGELGRTPQVLAKQPVPAIEAIVKPCGLGPQKAKAIQKLSQILLDEHEGPAGGIDLHRQVGAAPRLHLEERGDPAEGGVLEEQ
jgi:endonuclease-3